MRRVGLGGFIAIIVAAVVGFFTTLALLGIGDLVPLLVDTGLNVGIQFLLERLQEIVTITIAFTIFIGLLNLYRVHLGRVRNLGGRGDWFNSLLLVLSATLVFVVTILERNGILDQSAPISSAIFEYGQLSIESSLAGLLALSLVYGAIRLTQRKISWDRIVFVLAVVLWLLSISFEQFGFVEFILATVRDAGARGILMGVAIGTVIAGVRVMIGQDRSYRE